MSDSPVAWGYVRLSRESDTSIDQQKESIRQYCCSMGLNLATTRNDGENTSGFDEERHEYQLIREKIKAGEIDVVVTRDRARLSRDFDDRLSIITDLRETGVQWHVVEVGNHLEMQNIQNAGMECLHAMMDHVKKQAEISRAKQAVRERKERGCYQGKPPLGITFRDDGCYLEKSEEWDTVEAVFDRLGDGEKPEAIAEEVGLERTTIRRMENRGIEYYTDLLEKYSPS